MTLLEDNVILLFSSLSGASAILIIFTVCCGASFYEKHRKLSRSNSIYNFVNSVR